ncbi:chromosome condensation regulator [Paenibacillus elgii]|uniref:RCC1 domain-containing protein n=1 Tax=Paenibacillus elgii TaxID=189691 RepID=UPI000248DDAC|nr:chromosome condensation regulator [Paenibacillus elgii]
MDLVDRVDVSGFYSRASFKRKGMLWILAIIVSLSLLLPLPGRSQAYGQDGSNTMFVTVSSSYSHTVAVRGDGTVWTWGANDFGQLGYDTGGADQPYPRQVPGIANASAAAAGGNPTEGTRSAFTLVLTSEDGVKRVKAWGSNNKYQLGDGTTNGRIAPGNVKLGAGYDLDAEPVAAVTAGYDHAALLFGDGKVAAWGDNTYGQLGNGDQAPSGFPVFVKNKEGTGDLAEMKEIALGAYHSLARSTDKTVLAWGRNNKGQLGDNTTTDKRLPVEVVRSETLGDRLTNIYGISAGNEHSVAKGDGQSVYVWGSNEYGQLGLGPTLGHRSYASRMTMETGNPIGDARGAAAGGDHTLLIRGDGETAPRTLYVTGLNDFGQAGRPDRSNAAFPIAVPLPGSGSSGTGPGSDLYSGEQVDGIVGGAKTTYILSSGNKLYGLGDNRRGQLGTGRTMAPEYSAAPIEIDLSPVKSLTATNGIPVQKVANREGTGAYSLRLPRETNAVILDMVLSHSGMVVGKISAGSSGATASFAGNRLSVGQLPVGQSWITFEVADSVTGTKAPFEIMIVRQPAAGDSLTLLSVGDVVSYAGKQWLMVDPASRILVSKPGTQVASLYWNNAYKSNIFNADNPAYRFDPAAEGSVGKYLNQDFYNNLGETKRWIATSPFDIKTYDFVNGQLVEKGSFTVNANVGLLTKDQLAKLSGLIDPKLLSGHWLINPLNDMQANKAYPLLVGAEGKAWFDNRDQEDNGTRAVLPVIALKEGVVLAGGSGTDRQPYEITLNEMSISYANAPLSYKPETRTYSLSVPGNMTQVQLGVTLYDPNATFYVPSTVTGVTYDVYGRTITVSDLMENQTRSFSVVAKIGSGFTSSFQVEVTRQSGPSGNTALRSVTYNSAPLVMVAADQYLLTVGPETDAVSLQIVPDDPKAQLALKNQQASVEWSGGMLHAKSLVLGQRLPVELQVTAENGNTALYTIFIDRVRPPLPVVTDLDSAMKAIRAQTDVTGDGKFDRDDVVFILKMIHPVYMKEPNSFAP